MSNRVSLLRSLRHWHRRIGLTLFIWIFFVAFTGIALNHAKDFSLDSLPLPNAILSAVYGIDPPAVESDYIKGHWASVVGGHQLYLDHKSVGYCKQLTGTSSYGQEIYIGCVDSVYLVNEEGEIVEQLNALFGLPAPVSQLGQCGELPCLTSNGKTYVLNPIQFSWEETDAPFKAVPESETPHGLREALQRENSPQDFHFERLVRDLHSGAFFGLGPWLMDIFAVTLMVLATTGITLWWLSRRK